MVQQAAAVRTHSDLQVGEYISQEDVSARTHQQWSQEMMEKQVCLKPPSLVTLWGLHMQPASGCRLNQWLGVGDEGADHSLLQAVKCATLTVFTVASNHRISIPKPTLTLAGFFSSSYLFSNLGSLGRSLQKQRGAQQSKSTEQNARLQLIIENRY